MCDQPIGPYAVWYNHRLYLGFFQPRWVPARFSMLVFIWLVQLQLDRCQWCLSQLCFPSYFSCFCSPHRLVSLAPEFWGKMCFLGGVMLILANLYPICSRLSPQQFNGTAFQKLTGGYLGAQVCFCWTAWPREINLVQVPPYERITLTVCWQAL